MIVLLLARLTGPAYTYAWDVSFTLHSKQDILQESYVSMCIAKPAVHKFCYYK